MGILNFFKSSSDEDKTLEEKVEERKREKSCDYHHWTEAEPQPGYECFSFQAYEIVKQDGTLKYNFDIPGRPQDMSVTSEDDTIREIDVLVIVQEHITYCEHDKCEARIHTDEIVGLKPLDEFDYEPFENVINDFEVENQVGSREEKYV